MCGEGGDERSERKMRDEDRWMGDRARERTERGLRKDVEQEARKKSGSEDGATDQLTGEEKGGRNTQEV